MKTYIALLAATTLVVQSYASDCWSEKYGYECCSPTYHPLKTIDYRQGIWAVEDDKWCGVLNGGVDASKPCWSHKYRYPCCTRSHNFEILADETGSWGIENGDWCGVVEDEECWANKLGYPCCVNSTTTVQLDLSPYKWGMENGIWCGIIEEKTETETEVYSIQGENPFKNRLYINPEYVELVNEAIARMGDTKLIQKAKNMRNYSNAIWLNYINDLLKSGYDRLESNLRNALEEQKVTGEKVLTVFVLNALPGRDCTRLNKLGELLPNKPDMERYKVEYIDRIEEIVKKYKNQPIVFIVEPSTYYGLISYNSKPDCREASDYYYEGVAYAIQKLGVIPNVALYLDVGDSSVTGYDDNRDEAVKIYRKILQAGSPGTIRGFSTNVANYRSWSDPSLSRGPETEWNPNPDEQRFITALHKDFVNYKLPAYFIEDTSRSGKKVKATSPAEWCNQVGAGPGFRPEAEPIKSMDYLDAFYWVKPFGISDGTSDPSSPRYDGFCGHNSSMKPAPDAGEWFQSYFELGLDNANPSL